MSGEGWVGHQSLAAAEAVERIGPEIVGGILVGVLDEAPERPQQIAHRLVDDDPAHAPRATARRRNRPRSSPRSWAASNAALDREVAEIPQRIVHAGIFPVDDPHALAGIEKVLAQRIAMAGDGQATDARRAPPAPSPPRAPRRDSRPANRPPWSASTLR